MCCVAKGCSRTPEPFLGTKFGPKRWAEASLFSPLFSFQLGGDFAKAHFILYWPIYGDHDLKRCPGTVWPVLGFVLFGAWMGVGRVAIGPRSAAFPTGATSGNLEALGRPPALGPCKRGSWRKPGPVGESPIRPSSTTSTDLEQPLSLLLWRPRSHHFSAGSRPLLPSCGKQDMYAHGRLKRRRLFESSDLR